jgi:hypothetical protein
MMGSIDYEVREATAFGPLIGQFRSTGPDELKKGAFIRLSGGRWCVIGGPFQLEGASRKRVLVVAPVRERLTTEPQ